MSNKSSTEIIAGMSVFLSMSYIAFANPVFMEKAVRVGPGVPTHGMSTIGVFVATCLITAIATFCSGRYSKSPAALAPGLALCIVFQKFLTSKETTIEWESALVVSFLAGLVLLLLSLGATSVRRILIDAIPPTIKKAIMAGIGSVLAGAGIDVVRYYPSTTSADSLTDCLTKALQQDALDRAKDATSHVLECVTPNLDHLSHGIGFFSVGLFIILVGYFGLRGLATKVKMNDHYASWIDILGRVSFVVSIVVVAVLVSYLDPGAKALMPAVNGSLWPWLDSMPFTEALRGAVRLESIPLFIMIFYILLLDIVGSPYHLASLARDSFDSREFTPKDEYRVKASFYVDSVANILAPILGSTPVVYYAENVTGRVLGGRRSLVAYTVAAGFMLLLAVGVGFWLSGRALTSFIPQIAIAPVLFVVGLIIMSEAFVGGKKKPADSPTPDGAHARSAASRNELANLVMKVPAPLAIVVTPLAGFETGIAAGMLFYVTIALWFGEEEFAAEASLVPADAKHAELQRRLKMACLFALTFLAVLGAFVRAKLFLGF
jgi:AGZA family xanthine/uracil permease-like MFS transporter